jgi:hypothetical protein
MNILQNFAFTADTAAVLDRMRLPADGELAA